MVKRLFQWLKRPSNTSLGVLLVIGMVLGILFWGGFNTAMEETNRLEFCISCHEMTTVYNEYRQSPHYKNASGVRAACPDCHVPKDWVHKFIRKIQASNELYHKVVGTIDTPEKFKARRLELARHVWEGMEDTDSRECRNCHAFDTMVVEAQRSDAQYWHPVGMEEGFTCIDCHKGIAHHLPDMQQALLRVDQAYEQALEPGHLTGKRAYPIYPAPLYASKAGDAPVLGEVYPGAPLTLVQRGKERSEVVATGKELFAAPHRLVWGPLPGVLMAELDRAKLDYPQGEATLVDVETRIPWRPAEVRGWVDTAVLTQNPEGLWDYARSLYQTDCTRCHAAYPPGAFAAVEWRDNLRNMRRFTNLNREQRLLVLQYLRTHAAETSQTAESPSR